MLNCYFPGVSSLDNRLITNHTTTCSNVLPPSFRLSSDNATYTRLTALSLGTSECLIEIKAFFELLHPRPGSRLVSSSEHSAVSTIDDEEAY